MLASCFATVIFVIDIFWKCHYFLCNGSENTNSTPSSNSQSVRYIPGDHVLIMVKNTMLNYNPFSFIQCVHCLLAKYIDVFRHFDMAPIVTTIYKNAGVIWLVLHIMIEADLIITILSYSLAYTLLIV